MTDRENLEELKKIFKEREKTTSNQFQDETDLKEVNKQEIDTRESELSQRSAREDEISNIEEMPSTPTKLAAGTRTSV